LQKKIARPKNYGLGEWGATVKDHLPPQLRTFFVDVFFRYMPITVIRLLWKEVAGYFRLKTPTSGEVVVDAGAWTGHFTVIAARLVGPTGKVIAIEPQKIMCDRLKSRLRRLGLNNVTVVNSALFDSVSELSVPSRNDSGFNVLRKADVNEKADVVTLRPLDDILSSLNVRQVNFIKMDIEGAELEALSGMHTTLSSTHPFLAIASYHYRDGIKTCSRVEEILKGLDYSAKTGHRWHLTTWGWPNDDENTTTLATMVRGI
jgi:FkbM family methyltransferase